MKWLADSHTPAEAAPKATTPAAEATKELAKIIEYTGPTQVFIDGQSVSVVSV